MRELLDIGKIVNTRGIKGEVKVIPLTDRLERFNCLEWIYIDKNNCLEKYFIESTSFFKNFVYIKFKEVKDLETAENLKGLYVKVDRENAVKLPQDTYFICDLIDSHVYECEGRFLGKLKDVLKTGSNDVYIIETEGEKEILVPALKTVVKEINLEEKIIRVSLPEGLI